MTPAATKKTGVRTAANISTSAQQTKLSDYLRTKFGQRLGEADAAILRDLVRCVDERAGAAIEDLCAYVDDQDKREPIGSYLALLRLVKTGWLPELPSEYRDSAGRPGYGRPVIGKSTYTPNGAPTSNFSRHPH